MNRNSRLSYHLQLKEEALEEKAKKLEAAQHEMAMKAREQEISKKEMDFLILTIKERLENTHLLYQTKLENLNALLAMKEEGWQQELDIINHEQKMKDYLHKEELSRLNHKMDMKDLVHKNEQILDRTEHQRELLSLDQQIAEQMQDIFLLQRNVQKLEHSVSFKDEELGLVREQNVLENKKGQLLQAMYQQLSKQTEWKEDYMEKLEKLRDKEYELKEKGLEFYASQKGFEFDIREEKLGIQEDNLQLEKRGVDLQSKEKEIDISKQELVLQQKDLDLEKKNLEGRRYYDEAYRKNIDAAFSEMNAEYHYKKGRLENDRLSMEMDLKDKESKLKDWYYARREKLASLGKEAWRDRFNSEKTMYGYWKNHNTYKHEIFLLEQERNRTEGELKHLQGQASSLRKEKEDLQKEIEELKALPKGKNKK